MSTFPPPTIGPDLEEPIRAELFSVERLEQHAESLAAAQIVFAESRAGRLLTPRVLENGRVLLESYRAIARAIHEQHEITPAAEWLVHSRAARQEADRLADSLLGTGGQSPVSPATALRRFENTPLATAFAVQLVQRLRDLDPKVRPILLWLDERLAAQGTTADSVVHA